MALGLAVVAGRLAAQAVDRAVARGRGEPAAGVGREPGLRPAFARDEERLLDHLFGEVDVAEETDQGGDDPTGLLPEDPLEVAVARLRARCRFLLRPGTAAPRPGPCRPRTPVRASASAASRSGASMTQKPPRCSFDLGERAVGDHGLAVLGVHDGRDVGRFETAAEHPLAGGLDLGVERVDLLGRRSASGRAGAAGRRGCGGRRACTGSWRVPFGLAGEAAVMMAYWVLAAGGVGEARRERGDDDGRGDHVRERQREAGRGGRVGEHVGDDRQQRQRDRRDDEGALRTGRRGGRTPRRAACRSSPRRTSV